MEGGGGYSCPAEDKAAACEEETQIDEMFKCSSASMTVKWQMSKLVFVAVSSADSTHLYTNEPALRFAEERAGERRGAEEVIGGRGGILSLRRQLEIDGSC